MRRLKKVSAFALALLLTVSLLLGTGFVAMAEEAEDATTTEATEVNIEDITTEEYNEPESGEGDSVVNITGGNIGTEITTILDGQNVKSDAANAGEDDNNVPQNDVSGNEGSGNNDIDNSNQENGQGNVAGQTDDQNNKSDAVTEMAEADKAIEDAEKTAEEAKKAAEAAAADQYASDADKKTIDDANKALDDAVKAAAELPENASAQDKKDAAKNIADAAAALKTAADTANVNSAAAKAKAEEEADAASVAPPAATKVTAPLNITAKKVLKGRTLKKDEFRFELSDPDKDVIADNITNDANGTVTFPEIDLYTYKNGEFAKEGSHVFKVREKVPSSKDPDIIYDTDVENVTVKVTVDEPGTLDALTWKNGTEVKHTVVDKSKHPNKSKIVHESTARWAFSLNNVTESKDTRIFKDITSAKAEDKMIVNALATNKEEGYTDTPDNEKTVAEQINKALYYGYLGQRAGDLGVTGDSLYRATQIAIWQITHFGKNKKSFDKIYYKGSTNNFSGTKAEDTAALTLLNDYVLDNSMPAPASGDYKIYLFEAEADTATSHNLISADFKTRDVLKVESNTPVFDNVYRVFATQVTVGGQSASATKAAEISNAAAATLTTFTDTITYDGLTAGATYDVTGTLYKTKEGTKELSTPEKTGITSKSTITVPEDETKGEKDMTFSFAAGTLDADSTYVVVEEAVNQDDEEDSAKHEDYDDLAQTIVVKTSGEITSTTVTAGGKTATSIMPATLDAATATATQGVAISDRIVYSNLTRGATYSVTASLYRISSGTTGTGSASGSSSANGSSANPVSSSDSGAAAAAAVYGYVYGTDSDRNSVLYNVSGSENQANVREIGGTNSYQVSQSGDTARVSGGSQAAGSSSSTPVSKVLVAQVSADRIAGSSYSSPYSSSTDDSSSTAASGTWDISFGNRRLEAGATYAVVIRAVNRENQYDIVEHNNDCRAVSEMIKVDVAQEAANAGITATTVSINGKAATSTTPREIAAVDAAKVTTITDTITYTGFVANQTYRVTGTIYKISTSANRSYSNTQTTTNVNPPTTVAPTTTTTTYNGTLSATSMTVTQDYTASSTGAGTWTMNFTAGVKLDPGTTYVVKQEAVNISTGKTFTHANWQNQRSEMIVVLASGAPNTGDNTNMLIWIILIIFAGALGTTAIMIRNRSGRKVSKK